MMSVDRSCRLKNREHRRIVRDARGFTLIELLVCIAIVSLLLSLVGAALMSARESSRRMQCSSHLKQVGLATQAYEASHGKLPCSGLLGFRYLSANLEGLPGSWDLQGFFDPCLSGPCPEMGEWKRPPVYLCPSDPISATTRRSMSFRFCSGLAPINGAVGVSDGIGLGDITEDHVISFQNITDGLSTTAMASEQLLPVSATATSLVEFLQAPSSAQRDPLRFHWEIPLEYDLPSQLAEFLSSCDTEFDQPKNHRAGRPFSERIAAYDHVRSPNTRSCYNATQMGASLAGGPFSPATSLHRNGVNLLLCDGSVRRIQNGIDLRVWHSLGTRNGSESSQLSE